MTFFDTIDNVRLLKNVVIIYHLSAFIAFTARALRA